ncbi:MAG: universal stress protein [Woeseia sp.]
MRKVSQILSVIDPTVEEQPAMRRAAWIAARTGAELELFVCYYNEYLSGERLFDSSSLEKTRKEVIDGYEKHLEKLAAPLRDSGLKVRTCAVWDHPLSDGIVRHAAAINADLVFKDAHHHSAISRALLTNTDWSLIRACASPLWLVKSGDLPEKPLFLAAIDPMNEHDKPAALDDEILLLSKALTEAAEAELRVFHSYDPRVALSSATANAYIPVSLPFDEIEQQMRQQHEKRFNEIIDYHEIDRARAHLVSGLAHEEIPALAEELGALVVVMGAVARNRLKRLFIGATAERTLGELPCDMLIVKPDWFHTAQPDVAR